MQYDATASTQTVKIWYTDMNLVTGMPDLNTKLVVDTI